mgnify:CR=1 FL=1
MEISIKDKSIAKLELYRIKEEVLKYASHPLRVRWLKD